MNKSLLIFVLVVGLLTIFALPVLAQGSINPEGVLVLDQAPESTFVFHLSPTQASVGDNVWVLYAWGYLGDPAQTLTITTTFPAGVNPGNCPDGCVQVLHLVRDPYGGAGISYSMQAQATEVGVFDVVAHFTDDMGVSETITVTLTVTNSPTAVSLTSITASGEPQAGFFEGFLHGALLPFRILFALLGGGPILAENAGGSYVLGLLVGFVLVYGGGGATATASKN